MINNYRLELRDLPENLHAEHGKFRVVAYDLGDKFIPVLQDDISHIQTSAFEGGSIEEVLHLVSEAIVLRETQKSSTQKVA